MTGSTSPSEIAIERISLAGLGAQGFGRWLDQWQAMKRAGWSVTVLVANDGSHAIGLACGAPNGAPKPKRPS